MNEIDLRKNLFLCPVFFDGEACGNDGQPLPLETADNELHFTQSAAEMLSKGSEIALTDAIPQIYTPAMNADRGVLHLREIKSPDGKSYIPLFISFQMLVSIFGSKVHIGVVSFEDAKKLSVSEEKLQGIVVAPGQINRILSKDMLSEK